MRPRKYKQSTVIDKGLLATEQDGRCAICRRELSYSRVIGAGCCLDHCHKTGYVRGTLCPACNSGLGDFQDDPAILARAILYLTHLPQRLAHFEGNGPYVPVWPIFAGDKTEEDFSDQWLEADRLGFEFEDVQNHMQGYLNPSEVQDAKRRALARKEASRATAQ